MKKNKVVIALISSLLIGCSSSQTINNKTEGKKVLNKDTAKYILEQRRKEYFEGLKLEKEQLEKEKLNKESKQVPNQKETAQKTTYKQLNEELLNELKKELSI